MIQTTGDRNETDTRNRRAFSRKIVFPAFLLVGAAAGAASYSVTLVGSESAEAVLSRIEATSHPFGALLVDLRSRMSTTKLASLSPPPAVSEAPVAETSPPAPVAAPEQEASPRAAPLTEHIAPLPPRRPAGLAFPLGREGFRAPAHDVAATRKTALSPAPADNRSLFERFFGALQPATSALAYAPSDTRVSDAWARSANPALRYEDGTAVYDISGHTVYLPDGTKLEAHSGLGDKFDDPRFAHVRMRGVTPPHVYDLTFREKPFHGVRAIRLTPVGGEGNIFGRVGLLAHTYMLGPRGDSNGCVSFKNYSAFLRAFEKGEIKRLVVVARLG
jgi:hypothetical protein